MSLFRNLTKYIYEHPWYMIFIVELTLIVLWSATAILATSFNAIPVIGQVLGLLTAAFVNIPIQSLILYAPPILTMLYTIEFVEDNKTKIEFF